MTQKEFIDKISKASGCSYEQTDNFLQAFVDEIYNALEAKDKVTIRGLCTFKLTVVPAKHAKCPRTGEINWYQAKASINIISCTKLKEYLTLKIRKNEPYIAEPI